MNLKALHAAIAKIAPIDGVAVNPNRIDFKPEVTEEQRLAAKQILKNWEDPQEPNWEEFGTALEISPAYLRISTADAIATKLSGTLEMRLEQTSRGEDRLENVCAIWNQMANLANPTAEEIESLNWTIKKNAIDQFFMLQADGTMVLT